jgi:hypothetical protein
MAAGCPGYPGQPRFEVADIVRRHRHELERQARLNTCQRRALSAMADCRTAALGGHLDVCPGCDFERPSYNSCRNRHCCKCQAPAQEQWIAARSERLLPVCHWHVVFTLPSQLRSLARCLPRLIFDALFRAASETVLELGQSRLHAQLGVTMVLHTWSRELQFHPHAHALVTAGGLSPDAASWIPSGRKYLFPVEVMGQLLRGKMLAALRRLHARGHLDRFDEFRDPEGFELLMARLARCRWLVYAKRPFREARHVVAYLGRYTHRVAISNSRLVNVSPDAVTFRTKNGQTTTLAPVEFLRRLVLHVLPDGFHKIRHYGLYAGFHVQRSLVTARGLLTQPSDSRRAPAAPSDPLPAVDAAAQLLAWTGRDVAHCPRCGAALHRRPLAPTCRAPPLDQVA